MIAILGGTFDPIHYGHLRTALDVMEALGLEQIRFLPLNQAVHREQPLATVEQRLAMVRLAIADQAGFALDETECRRQGPSYMVDTLRSLRNELGGIPLALLLGMDAFKGFLGWREPQAILNLCHLVVMGRPGYPLPTDGELGALVAQYATDNAEELQRHSGGRIYFQPVTQIDISASDIRARTAGNRSPRYLLPDPVIAMIRREELYGLNRL